MAKKKSVPERNEELIDIAKFKDQIKSDCKNFTVYKDLIKYLIYKKNVVSEELFVVSQIDSSNGNPYTNENLELYILREDISDDIKLLTIVQQAHSDLLVFDNSIPVINEALKDIQMFMLKVKTDCKKIFDDNNDLIKYLISIYKILCNQIKVVRKENFLKKIPSTDELKELYVYKKNILNAINASFKEPQNDILIIEDPEAAIDFIIKSKKNNPLNRQVMTKVMGKGEFDFIMGKQGKSLFDIALKELHEGPNLSKATKPEDPENVLIIWNNSESVLRKFLDDLIAEKFLKKETFENLLKHFFIESSPESNAITKVAPEKKICWLGNLRQLAFLIHNLNKKSIISTSLSNEDLTIEHFYTEKYDSIKYESIRTTFKKIKEFDKNYIYGIYENNSNTKKRFQELYELIQSIASSTD